MNGKNMLFGLGLGLVCSGAALLLFNQNSTQQMTDAEIKKRAEQLGMVEENQNAILTSEVKGNKDEIENSSADEADDVNQDGAGDKQDTDSVSEDEKEVAESDADRENSNLNPEDGKKPERNDSAEQETGTVGDMQNASSVSKPTGESEIIENTENKNTGKKKKKKKTAKEQETEDVGTTVIEIRSGMSAISICRILQEKGLIENAEDFKDYLVGQNIQHELRAGMFEIPNNADYEKIASLIHKGDVN